MVGLFMRLSPFVYIAFLSANGWFVCAPLSICVNCVFVCQWLVCLCASFHLCKLRFVPRRETRQDETRKANHKSSRGKRRQSQNKTRQGNHKITSRQDKTTRQPQARQDKTRRGKGKTRQHMMWTRQDKTTRQPQAGQPQDKTRQDMTRHDKTR
jgi:hypothetical protein